MTNQDFHDDNLEPQSTGLVLPSHQFPDKLYVVPIHNRPFFPAQVLPVIVNQQPWGRTLRRVENTEHKCLAVFL